MAFSLPQIVKHFRPMVDRAWVAHCRRECITEDTRASKDAWYRAELKKVFGRNSTARLGKSKDFDTAMAHFEQLVDDGGIEWQIKALGGSQKRARYLVDKVISDLRLSEEYVTSIAERMGTAKGLRDYTVEELVRFRIALLTHVRRRQAAALHHASQEQLPGLTPTER